MARNFYTRLMDRETREGYEYLNKVDNFDRELASAIKHDAEDFIREIFHYGLDFYEENDTEEEFNKVEVLNNYMVGVLGELDQIDIRKYIEEGLKK